MIIGGVQRKEGGVMPRRGLRKELAGDGGTDVDAREKRSRRGELAVVTVLAGRIPSVLRRQSSVCNESDCQGQKRRPATATSGPAIPGNWLSLAEHQTGLSATRTFQV